MAAAAGVAAEGREAEKEREREGRLEGEDEPAPISLEKRNEKMRLRVELPTRTVHSSYYLPPQGTEARAPCQRPGAHPAKFKPFSRKQKRLKPVNNSISGLVAARAK